MPNTNACQPDNNKTKIKMRYPIPLKNLRGIFEPNYTFLVLTYSRKKVKT